MAKILVADGMEKSAIDKLTSAGHEIVVKFFEPEALGEALKGFDCVVVRSATKVRQPHIDTAKTGKLKLVIRGGVGVDNIDVKYAEENGITVRNTPMASSASVAECTIGHMFCIARYLHIANYTMRNGKWDKKLYEGIELGGKTLGVVGFGRIGREVAKRASALGMKIQFADPFIEGDLDGAKKMEFDQLISSSDFITFHIPGNVDKSPVISAKEISKMKDGVYLVNTARGGVINENDLCDALDSGKVAAAALDVYSEEPTKNERVYTHPKISLTPHIAASTIEAQERIGEEIVDIIMDFFK